MIAPQNVMFELHKAVYDKLKAAGLDVQDEPCPGHALPYAVVAEGTFDDWGTKTDDGLIWNLPIHVWSAYKGMKEVYERETGVLTALMDRSAPLSIASGKVCGVKFDSMDGLRDEDGTARHGIVQLRIFVTW